MAITKSAKEALRQSERRKIQNVKRKKTLRSLLKEAKGLVAQNKKEEAKKLLPQIYQALDKAAKTNVLKKNAASRKKSRVALLLSK